MAVYHVLADGQKVETIKGRVIRPKENRGLYEIIRAINKRVATDRGAKSAETVRQCK